MNETKGLWTRFRESLLRKYNRIAVSMAGQFKQMYKLAPQFNHKTKQELEAEQTAIQRFFVEKLSTARIPPRFNGVFALIAAQIAGNLGSSITPELQTCLEKFKNPSNETDQTLLLQLQMISSTANPVAGSFLSVASGPSTGGGHDTPKDITVTLVALNVLATVIGVLFLFLVIPAGITSAAIDVATLGYRPNWAWMPLTFLEELYKLMFPEAYEYWFFTSIHRTRGGTKRRRNYRLKNNLYKTTIS